MLYGKSWFMEMRTFNTEKACSWGFLMKVRYVFLLFFVTSPLCRWCMADNPIPGVMEVPTGPGGPQASLKRLLVDSGGNTPTVKKFNHDGVRELVELGEPIV